MECPVRKSCPVATNVHKCATKDDALTVKLWFNNLAVVEQLAVKLSAGKPNTTKRNFIVILSARKNGAVVLISVTLNAVNSKMLLAQKATNAN